MDASDQGLQGGWAVDDGGNTAFARSVEATLPLMRQAGAGWVRINFRLGQCFRDWTSPGCRGSPALAAYDAVVAAAQGAGLHVLGLLSNESWPGDQAQWTAGSAEQAGGDGDNPYLRSFSLQAAAVLARHFAGRVQAWEVWNEPNAWSQSGGAGRYWGGTFLYPSNYAWLLRHVYEDTRQAGAAGVQLISGGLFGHDIGGSLSSGVPYLQGTFRYGRSLAGWDELRARLGSYPLGGVGQHLYLDQGGRASRAKIAACLQEVRAAYEDLAGPHAPGQTHVTEIGWRTDVLSEAVQAENLRLAYDTFHCTAHVARAYWTAIQDIPEAPLYYGLLRADGSPKPAFAAYQAAAGGGTGQEP